MKQETGISIEEEDEIIEGSRDPVVWVEEVLGCRLWKKQGEILRAVKENPRVTVRSCDGAGKSFVAGCGALWFLYNYRPATVITTAPTFRQVESILWKEIATRYFGSKIPLGGELTNTGLKIEDKWFAIGLSTNEPERFQGLHNTNVLVIADEASGIDEATFNAIENPLATGFTRLLLISNPTQVSGTYYRSFQSSSYKTIQISAYDTPNFTELGITESAIRETGWKAPEILPYPYLVSPTWVKQQIDEFGVGSFQYIVHVKGDFPAAGVNNLFLLSDVEAAIKRVLEPGPELVASLDVSRYGDDETIYLLRQGNKVVKIDSWAHQDTVFTAGRTARHLREDKPIITRVDEVGVGGGVADMLISEGFRIDRFNSGAAPIDKEKFANRRAELFWLLSRRFADGQIQLPDNRKLVGQLCDLRYEYDTKSRLVIESKEHMKSRGSRSPDIADALMMAFKPVPKASTYSPVDWG